MNKASSAIILASLSAMAQQAYAQKAIEIDETKVSTDLVSDIAAVLAQKEPHNMIGNNFKSFSDQLFINGEGLGIDVDAYLSRRGGGADSTRSVSGSIASVCYSNCHSACHGSRGWR